MNIFTTFLPHMLNAFNGWMKLKQNMWSVYGKNLMTSFLNLVQRLSLDASLVLHSINFALNRLYLIVVAETVVGATTGVVPPPRGYLKGK